MLCKTILCHIFTTAQEMAIDTLTQSRMYLRGKDNITPFSLYGTVTTTSSKDY